MIKYRCRNSISSLPLLVTNYGMQATVIVALLFIFGCGDETINAPLGGTRETEDLVPVSAIYYPMTVGSRWVYRNPDGSEWSREVIKSDVIAHDSYHSLIYNPPLVGEHPDFIKSPTYVVDPAGIILQTRKNDINDAVWQTVLLSQGDFSGWSIRRGFRNGVWSIRKKHDDILVSLFYSQIRVTKHSDFTLLHFPPDDPQQRKVINMTISGNDNFTPESYVHGFEAQVRIWGNTTIEPVVATSIGGFENCLKIEFDVEATPVKTLVYKPGELRAGHTEEEHNAFLELLEDELNGELTKLLPSLMQNLNLGTMWLAPGIGPVKIETTDGIAELIDYQVAPVGSSPNVFSY